MKLIIQIPSFNEEATLPETLKSLPTTIEGVDSVEVLVINDGSTDNTSDIAKTHGAHHVLNLSRNLGLANAFILGIKESLRLGADIIVNTDADNQYKSDYISNLIQPVLNDEADLTIGDRQIQSIPHFSPLKKFLQKMGNRMVQLLTDTDVKDVASGFRAYSSKAARRLRVFSDFSYTIETFIQASKTGLRIQSVPIEVNPPTRKSRLFKSNFFYIRKQTATMFRIWALYSPVKLFSRCGLISLGLGSILLFRFLYFYLQAWPNPSGKIQSLIIASIFFMFGFFMILTGVIADLLAVNRRLNEEILENLTQKESDEAPQSS